MDAPLIAATLGKRVFKTVECFVDVKYQEEISPSGFEVTNKFSDVRTSDENFFFQ